ncbi:MAG: GNAT family N-acetyltransferase [Candidatus Heimdallarchaeota archaeon]|nr:GNAT family N-acetyltransferase [Candidatus Heimdallarchaeota archaeon]
MEEITEISLEQLESYRDLFEERKEDESKYPWPDDIVNFYKQFIERGVKFYALGKSAFLQFRPKQGMIYVYASNTLPIKKQEVLVGKLLDCGMELLKDRKFIILLGPHTDFITKYANNLGFRWILHHTYKIPLEKEIQKLDLSSNERIEVYMPEMDDEVIILLDQFRHPHTNKGVFMDWYYENAGGIKSNIDSIRQNENMHLEGYSRVLKIDEKIVGVCTINKYKEDDFLYEIIIDKKYRGLGLGKKLASHTLADYQRSPRNKGKILIKIERENIASLALFDCFNKVLVEENDLWVILRK